MFSTERRAMFFTGHLKETSNVFHWSLERDGQCFPLVTWERQAMFSTGHLKETGNVFKIMPKMKQ